MTYGNGRNGPAHTYPQVWVTDTHVFAIMVTLGWRPVACKLTKATGTWATADLTAHLGMVDPNDNHRALALGVDWEGRVLVCGNMHVSNITIARSGANADFSAWTSAVPGEFGQSGDVARCTYPCFTAFSDGELWLKFAQQEPPPNGGSDGRDSVLYKLTPGSTVWQPVVGNGEFMVVAGTEVPPGNPPGTVDRRAYLFPGVVDQQDVFHTWGTWRLRKNPLLYTDLFYVRTRDRGATWENVIGQPVTAPLTYPLTLDQATVENLQQSPFNNGNLAIDPAGHPHGTYRGYFGDLHFWWTGSAWGFEALNLAFTDVAALSFVRGRLWYTGQRAGRVVSVDALTGAEARHGAAPPGLPVVGDVQYPNGASYLPAPDHVVSDRSTFFVPQGDVPTIYSLGDGPRHDVASAG